MDPVRSADRLAAPPRSATAAFFLDLARALQVFGMGAHRVEDALFRVARAWNIPAQFLATPTFVVMTVGPVDDAQTHV
ncbi:MAG: hypothetical protein D6701_06310, partial [Gemmatimonadetes bacterium]